MKAPNGLVYYRQGKGEETILMHPSLGLGRFLFHRVSPFLTPMYSIVTWDPRGIGDRRELEPNLSGWIDDVLTLLELTPGPIHLLGVSLGTWVMGRVAVLAAGRVTSLTLIGSSLGFVHGEQAVQERRRELERESMGDFGKRYAETTLMPGTQPEIRENLALELAGVDKDSYLKAMEAIYTVSNQEIFSQIDCPSLILVGQKDERTPPDMADAVAEAIHPPYVRIVPRAGHLAVLDQPGRVADYVAAFCKARRLPPDY